MARFGLARSHLNYQISMWRVVGIANPLPTLSINQLLVLMSCTLHTRQDLSIYTIHGQLVLIKGCGGGESLSRFAVIQIALS